VCRSWLGGQNTFPVDRKSWSSVVFRRVATGTGRRRYIGSPALQTWLHTLDYIFCDWRPCHVPMNVCWVSGLLLSVMTNCLSLSEHLTSLSREKLKRCVSTLLLDSRVRECPLPWFHLLQHENAKRDSIYCKTRQWKYYWLQNATCYVISNLKWYFLHVINSLLLTEKHDSIPWRILGAGVSFVYVSNVKTN
jgi:hypothetical protein